MSKATKVKRVYKLIQELKELGQNTKEITCLLAERLYTIKTEELYKQSADPPPSWAEFLADPEMPCRKRKADNLVRIWKDFVIDAKLKPNFVFQADYSNLRELCAIVTPDNAEELVHQAMTLSNSDITRLIRETKTGKTEMTCSHNWQPYWRCENCRAITKINPQKK